jgi:hypothetical protein
VGKNPLTGRKGQWLPSRKERDIIIGGKKS